MTNTILHMNDLKRADANVGLETIYK